MNFSVKYFSALSTIESCTKFTYVDSESLSESWPRTPENAIGFSVSPHFGLSGYLDSFFTNIIAPTTPVSTGRRTLGQTESLLTANHFFASTSFT